MPITNELKSGTIAVLNRCDLQAPAKPLDQCRDAILIGLIAASLVGCDSGRRENIPEIPRRTNQIELSADYFFAQAEQAFQADNLAEAEKQIRLALVQDPDNSQALFLSAHVAARTSGLEDAVSVLRSIPKDDPHFGVAARGQTAQWLSDLGRVYEAREVYRELLSQAPQNETVKHEFARFLNAVGWRYEAADVLAPLVSNGQVTESELLALLNVSTAYGKTQRTVSQQGPLSRALGELSERKPRQALESLSQFQGLGVSDPAVEAVAAAALAELQQFEELDSMIGRAHQEIENDPLYWRAVGDSARWVDDGEAAIGAYLRSLKLDPTSQIAHERLIAALLQGGNEETARLVDDRRALLLAVTEAVRAIGPGAPDDLRAGTQLIADIESLGAPAQAIAWLNVITSRHPDSQLARDAEQLRSRLGHTTSSETLRRQLCGMSIDDYPKPASRAAASLLPRTTVAASRERGIITDATFVDVAAPMGMIHRYLNAPVRRERNLQIYQSFGAGVAAIDYDLDGWLDFYCGQGSGDPPEKNAAESNVLFRRLADRFIQIERDAEVIDYGYTTGVSSGDLNQDGFPDLVIGSLGKNRLLLNQGDGTFRDVSEHVGWSASGGYTMSLAIADVTGDALADVIEVNYVNDPDMYKPIPIGPDGFALNFPGPLHFQVAAGPSMDFSARREPDGGRVGRRVGRFQRSSVRGDRRRCESRFGTRRRRSRLSTRSRDFCGQRRAPEPALEDGSSVSGRSGGFDPSFFGSCRQPWVCSQCARRGVRLHGRCVRRFRWKRIKRSAGYQLVR